MNWFSFTINLLLFVSAGVGFVFGGANFFKKQSSLFTQIVTCGFGCMMLGWLFNLVVLLTSRSLLVGFHVGKFGLIGGFMFLFSASFGQMNGLVDGGEKANRKYRLLALLAPLAVAAACLPLLFSAAGSEVIITNVVLCLFFGASAYYNLKHLIIPDVDFGILKSIRGYNFCALLLSILMAVWVVAYDLQWMILAFIVAALIAVVYIAAILVLAGGVKKWTI